MGIRGEQFITADRPEMVAWLFVLIAQGEELFELLRKHQSCESSLDLRIASPFLRSFGMPE